MKPIHRDITFQSRELEISEDGRSYSGYGVVFDSDSVPMMVWDEKRGVIEVVEQITADSLRDTDMTDVISAYNHDFSKIMGRTSAGTLELKQDSIGIFYRFEVPNTTAGNDLIESTKRGDIQGSSFVFWMDWEEGYDIEERADGKLIAKPKKINRMYEIGPVVMPAYPETTAQSRSSALAEAVGQYLQNRNEDEPEKDEQANPNKDKYKRIIELERLK